MALKDLIPLGMSLPHRSPDPLALTTVGFATLLALWRLRRPGGWALAAVAGWAWLQAGLGIATLLLQAPLLLASIHQASAVVLLALVIVAANFSTPANKSPATRRWRA